MIIPADLLKDKNILLGVSGSIAVYKSLELVRLFVKAGANVKVVMSEAAKKFVTPLTFETLTSHEVLDDFNESWVTEHNHIKTGEWADVFIIAPATANTMAKLAQGIADTMLLQTALAYPKKKILAPSANTHMLYNPITQENIEKLKSVNYTFVGTQTKELACKTTGDGAMAEPLEIFWATARELLQDEFWKDRNVLISGGGTLEKIDDVRYVSNFSSGKMASALATALYCKGAKVTLVATKNEPEIPQHIELKKVESSQEMFAALQNVLTLFKTNSQKKPYLFMAAAVSDYLPQTHTGKLKKSFLGKAFTLQMNENIDILASLDKEQVYSIGFKAEMDAEQAMENAQAMLSKKSLNAVCLNVLKDSTSFGTDTNTIEFISANTSTSLAHNTKLNIAFEIAKNAQQIEE
ncbi:MAG: bifunctional phosphopantothenoylcysteine decarboxylase/phosphopantothenate--cysteine ligase CoaBC [Campylobacterales bacterium]|nr:bifunctional phosphopantothenoylcysteine decarboxylase/phosphopantothenate--cysteine ligase CoaBC [Campylobacterales bacterium]